MAIVLKLAVSLLLTFSCCCYFTLTNAQNPGCRTTTPINRTVTEGDPANRVVINLVQEFNTATDFLYFTVIESDSAVFLNHFALNNDREITTRRTIDRDAIALELRDTYAPVVFTVLFSVFQAGPAPRQDCYNLLLIVKDENDNRPQFDEDVYSAFLDEGDPNAEYAILTATDNDEGINSTRVYELDDDLDKFTLEVEMRDDGGIVRVLLKLLPNVTLNYEEVTGYNLTVVAREGSPNPRSATLQVEVFVMDVCDEKPFFPTSAYFPTVRENSPIDTVISTNISAMDLDQIDRTRLRYVINDVCAQERSDSSCVHIPEHPFTLDRETGILTLTGEIDREVYEEYVISVHAMDGCDKSATASIMITVEDENDNAPIVDYTGGDDQRISENSPPETRIGFITITDRDERSATNRDFSVVRLHDNSTGTLSPSETFQLINSTELHIELALDREVTDRYSLVIEVTDNGTPSITTFRTLDITVTDFNDNPPVFDHSSIDAMYRIEENRPINHAIVTLSATDNDIDGNAVVSYHLPPSNSTFPHQHLFIIDEFGGTLKVNGTLDREQQATLQVLVQARDNPTSGIINEVPLYDYVIINITLIDLNDVTPNMITPSGDYSVSEDHPINTTVFRVSAVDTDTEMYSNLEYSFVPNDTPFRINPSTGIVTLTEQLDFDQNSQQRSYAITIRVSDGTNVGEEQLTIRITDVNDERPYFTPLPLYAASVNESESANHPVVMVTAIDIDTPTSDLRFSISSGNEQGHFRINSQTGQISTTVNLNREAISSYNLTVRVFDGVHYALEDAFVNITVIDANDNIPQFVGSPYVFDVDENMPARTRVASILAEDPDIGLNAQVRYFIMAVHPPEARHWFSLNEMNGEILTEVLLDRESDVFQLRSEVALQVRAQDSSSASSNTTTVRIIINDQNDQRPFFDQPRIEKSLSENHGRGSPFLTIQAHDNDQAPFNEILYSISNRFPPAVPQKFHIDPNTGALSLLNTLDYESYRQHNITVAARDANREDWQATQLIIINVINERELNLKCDNFFPMANLTENSPINHPVLVFECTDLRNETVDQVEYSLTNTDGTNSMYFGIRETFENGKRPATVYTLVNLDRDTLPKQANGIVQMTVVITARDPNNNENSYGSINSTLTIRILDVNDNPPRFSQNFYDFNIEEESDANRMVGRVSANDTDNEVNGTVTYSIQTPGPIPFTIDSSTGEIFASQRLDREVGSFYEFVVEARDGGSPSQQDTVDVRVRVSDLNDNDPVFDASQNRTINVGEEQSVGTIIETLIVTDDDSDMFGPIVVDIAPGSSLDPHFLLHQNGSIQLLQQLDRESETTYSFTARAQDSGGRSTSRKATATFTIKVLDYNDNPPVFRPEQPSQVTIREDHQPLAHIITASATDDDIDKNAKIKYILADKSLSRTFCIEPMTGVIKLCERHSSCPNDEIIDFERQRQYDVVVIAYDQKAPRHIVNKTVTIQITNVNEFAPEFEKNEVTVFVDEDTDNVEVASLRAYDKDNDGLTYEVLENGVLSSEFRYDNERRAIVNNRRLDYSTNLVYRLTLRARETAGTKNGSVQVDVFVNNINDHPPIFDVSNYPTSAQISESEELKEIVLTVHADDADNNTHDAVSYSIIRGNVNNSFGIDSLFGDIYVNNKLDYDTTTTYQLTILARDTGTPVKNATLQVTISLINENDESPIFNASEYSFTIAENLPPGTVVGSAHAEDHDVGTFGVIRYSFMQENAYFSINERSGEITSRVEIDREVYLSQADSTNPITFSVTATDQSLTESRSATTRVAVTILDVNDNAPTFSQGQYIISISPNQVANTTIDTIAAVDSDEGENAVPIYQITSSSSGISVHISSSGALSLLQPLPSSHEPQYDFVIRATDSRDSSKTSTTRVRFVVETETDHHPRFDHPEGIYSVDVAENTPTGISVFNVGEYVNDLDSGSYGDLSFAFDGEYPKFSIDSSSGVITLTQSLDFESETEYSLTILASDNTPGGARTTTATLRVSVTGSNEFAPTFTNLPSRITLSPITYLNINLFTLMARDDDDGDGDSRVEYSIYDPDRLFTVDQTTGIVRNQGQLLQGSTYTIQVSAFNPLPYLSSNATIVVNIADPGTMAPSFRVSNPVSYNVMENLEVGTSFAPAFVTQPRAQTYQIVRHNGSDEMFIISQTQGQFTLQSKLNHRLEQQYELIVEARIENRNDPNNIIRHSSFIKVNLVVLDVNDNPPRFLFTPTVQVIDEDREVNNVPLFTVTATDDDSGLNAEINYEITRGNLERVFRINESTGAVTLAEPLHWERQSSYELTIRAFDLSDRQQQTAEIIVPITVRDVNNNAPSFRGNYTIGVYEYPHTRMGDKIIRLAATDLDQRSSLRYTLDLLEARFENEIQTASRDAFIIDIDNGTVSVGHVSNIDRERIDYYLFRVTANDQRNEIATTYLTIYVQDVNDHTPELRTGESRIQVREDLPAGSIVTSSLFYTDGDQARSINSWARYSLGSGWPDGHFAIDPITGVIRIDNPILTNPAIRDREHPIIVTVLVTDQGVPQRSSTPLTLTITIADVNNNFPVFEPSSHIIPISITTQPGESFYNFNVSDADDIEHGTFTLSIPSYYDVAHNTFQIDTERRLSLKTHGQALDIGNYTFRVEAYTQSWNPDCARYQTASYSEVTVVVLPENTACPPFTLTEFTFNVMEGEQGLAQPIDTLLATDPDGNNVRYSVSLDSREAPFSIDEISGVFRLTSTLDRETKDNYEFTVFATDDGFPSRTCSSIVRISVLDINDNYPAFSRIEYEGLIAENTMPDEPILTVNASDLDEGSFGTVEYSLVDSGLPFRIDQQSGSIYVTRSLDCEADGVPVYNFPVLASDKGDPAMESSATVVIRVTGEDEFPPVFTEESYVFEVAPERRKGDIIGRVSAEDPDRCKQGVLIYSFVNPGREVSDFFRIENTTGNIILLKDSASQDTNSVPESTITKRQTSSSYVTLTATVMVTDGSSSSTKDIQLNVHNSFIVDPQTQEPFAFEIIAIVVAAVIAVITVFVIILIATLVCRRKRHSGSGKINDSEMNNGHELNSRFSSGRSQQALYKQTSFNNGPHEHTTLNHSSGSGSNSNRDSYTADDEMDSMNGEHHGGAYGSPGLKGKKSSRVSPRARSTSDLASSIGTEALTQDTAVPYDKAQIAAIYAANVGLLTNSSSHDSIHMFGSEGGGEDGDVDIGNMLFAKYNDIDDDDDDDSTTLDPDEDTSYQGKPHHHSHSALGRNMNVPHVEEDPIFYGSRGSNQWMPSVIPMEESINQIAHPGYELDDHHMYPSSQYSNSQGTSMYELPHGSRSSLIRHHTGPFSHSQNMHRQPMHNMSQEYGDYRDPYNPPPMGRNIRHHSGSRGKIFNSATALNTSDYHRDMRPPRTHMHVEGGFSQEPPYRHHLPYHHGRGIHVQSPGSSTPTDGTVTPQRAMGEQEYEQPYNLSSSSTSLGSTNFSGSHDQGSIDHRPY